MPEQFSPEKRWRILKQERAEAYSLSQLRFARRYELGTRTSSSFDLKPDIPVSLTPQKRQERTTTLLSPEPIIHAMANLLKRAGHTQGLESTQMIRNKTVALLQTGQAA